jgi:alkyldihydroxyacetonephosphate synthase
MKGSRYSLCGRRIAQLLPFIENEMKAGVNLSREVLQHTRSTLPKCALSQIDVGLLRTEIGEVSVSDVDRIRHGTGHCQKDVYLVRNGTPPRVPDAVVWPSGEAQVRKLVEMAATKSWCLIPFGGGTNVSQSLVCPPHCVEPRPIISVDLQLMNRILWIDEENGLARVEAGILGRTLAMELSIRGYTMGHEPDSIEFSTLGGWIATKSSGMKRSRYGNIEDIVKSVTVCCANGVSQHGDPDACTWGRESTGSNVHDLLFGSEGSLGIITSAVIRVWPLPDITEHEGIVFADFDAGFAFVRDVSRRLEGRMPASVRLLDNAHFRLGQALVPTPEFSLQGYIRSASRVALQMAYGLDWTRAVCATITYEGDRISVAEQRQAISAIAGAHGGIRLGSEAGRAGYELTYMIAYLRDFALTYQFLGESFETFAPWSKARTIVQATTDRLRREHAAQRLPGRPFVGCRVTQLYHEGACLYFYLCISIENVPDPSRVFADLEHAARQVILENGGSLSHHHGIGKARCGYLEGIQSTALQSNLEAVKKAMDPENIFGARNGLFACRDRMTACSIIDSKDVYS